MIDIDFAKAGISSLVIRPETICVNEMAAAGHRDHSGMAGSLSLATHDGA